MTKPALPVKRPGYLYTTAVCTKATIPEIGIHPTHRVQSVVKIPRTPTVAISNSAMLSNVNEEMK